MNDQCWSGYAMTGIYNAGVNKLGQLWKTIWRYLLKVKMYAPYGPANPLLDTQTSYCVLRPAVQLLLSRVLLFATPWTAARQASLSITNCQNLPKPMSIKSVMPSNHLILCHPLLLLPSIFPRIRDFSNESAVCIRWPEYWSFSFSISPSNEHAGLI